MKKLVLPAAILAALATLAVACGGGSSNSSATATKAPAATASKASAATPTKAPAATATAAADGTPISSAQLKTYMSDIKAVLADTIAKAQAGDVQGTRDAEGKGDTAMEAIIKSTRLIDPTLADKIEALELDYEAQADSDNTDLTVMIKDAQDALTLLDQAAVKLNISP